MSVYARFKRDPEGLRKLVTLLETTPAARRQKMIDVGMAEDEVYTQKAVQCVLTFEDVMNLPEEELAELVATAPTRMIGFALLKASEEMKQRFLKNARGGRATEIRDFLDATGISLSDIGGAQLKLVEITRTLEKRGLIKTKAIPAR